MRGKKRTAAAVITVLALALSAALTAAHGEFMADLGMLDPYENCITVSWQEMNVPKDTKLPVYSAPYEDAWRGAKGKASVSMKEKFRLLGTLDDGAWGLVDYKVDDKSRRIGWIRMPEGATRASEYGDMYMNRTLLKVTKTVTLTDDPENASRKIRTIKAGEQVIGMFTYQAKGRIYVETQHEGKTVWGFIPISAVTDISDSLIAKEGDTCTVADGVTVIGEMYEYVPIETTEDGETRWGSSVHIQPRDIQLRMVDLWDANMHGIKYLKLPESLRWIGMEGICTGTLEEVRFGGNIRKAGEAFYSVRIRRLVLAGTTTPNCIRTTCYDALSLDYDVVVLTDCTSSNSEEIQESNLRDMENAGAKLMSSQEFIW